MAERRVGPYVLLEQLGRGGMGVVYRALDTDKDRSVALKLLAPELAADDVFQARFRRESKLAARLSHPHIIPIHDYGEIDGHLFIDMALVPGADLAERLAADGPPPPAIAVDIIAQVASALDAAHAAKLLHRDVKPSNILLTTRASGSAPAAPHAYLVDFGIAKSQAGAGATNLTATQDVIGTVAYLAPERILGQPSDHHADIYSLACVLFECLTGRAPFTGEAAFVALAHASGERPRPSLVNSRLPAGLDAVTATGMARQPAARYPTAGQLAAAAARAVSVGGSRPAPPGQPATVRQPGGPRLPQSGQPPRPAPAAPRQAGYLPPAPGQPKDAQARPTAAFPPPAPGYPQRVPGYPQRAPGYPRPTAVAFWPTAGPADRRLPASYRFGVLAVPILAFLGVAAFVAPLEAFYAEIFGFVATVLVSRGVAAARYARSRGGRDLPALTLRWLGRDFAGMLGLIAVALGALGISIYLLMPAVGVGNPRDYARALQTKSPADVFSPAAQLGVFLHLFWLLPMLATAAIVLLRTRADPRRPLVLPRLARAVNGRPRRVRLSIAAALLAVTAGLIGLNGGLSVRAVPSGAVCAVAPLTCHSASLAGRHSRR
jgi:serine/threonine protein kinase